MAIISPGHSFGAKFIQKVSPTQPQEGDVWFNPAFNTYKIYQSGEWVIFNNKKEAGIGSNYGYIFGGNSNGISNVFRLQFPFNSGIATTIGYLAEGRRICQGCNSYDYGYTVGGQNVSSICRLQFPFNSGIANHVGDITHNKYGAASFNSSQHGFFAGGYETNAIGRFDFPFDTGNGYNVATLPYSKPYVKGCNSSTYGYTCGPGGNWGAGYVHKLEFPFDSGSAVFCHNIADSCDNYSCFNSSTYSYKTHGYPAHSSIERFQFSFDGSSAQIGTSIYSANNACGCNSSVQGFISVGGSSSNITRIDFPFDSGNDSLVGNLEINNDNHGALDGTDFSSIFI